MVDLQVLGPDSDLGRYRLVRLLGRGGMGEVYLAHDQSLDRDVAIKFISRDKTADDDARRRLMREARAAAALDHPSICTVLETGETADGRTYIVMQYIEGEPLTTVLEKRQLPIRDSLLLCADIAEALAVAHSHNVVHRDLKPANVMITLHGHPKLVDFGIAKVMQTPEQLLESATTSVRTTAGVVVGTPAYMSPEQAQQRDLDGRSDLFSLGALLFECLTGRRAFEGPTSLATIGAVLHVHPPAPSRLRSGLDDRHDELCRRLLAKEPDDRFQSAHEVVGAIRLLLPDTSRAQALPASSTDPAKETPRPKRRLAVAGIIAAVAIIAATTAWFSTRPRAALVPEDAQFAYRRGTDALREGAYYTATRSLQKAVQIFPGYTLAYARLAEAGAELDDYRLATDSLLRVGTPANLSKPERLRLSAVTSLVKRDIDQARRSYAELTQLTPGDAEAWLDLGRAQEAAGLPRDARASYEQALRIDRQYAPGYIRLGYVEALASRRDEALAAFAEAERLYKAAVDVEGQTEVLLRRGATFDSFNELKAARSTLERALSLATELNAPYQVVRARLSLSSVTVSEGRFAESEKLASDAVQDALTQGLDAVAADGLINLAATLNSARRLAEAEAHAQRAVQLAERRGARRTAAQGRVQLAAIYEEQGHAQKALDLLSDVLPFLKENQYRRFELLGLSVQSRALKNLDELDRAVAISGAVLSAAETLKDEGQVAMAVSNLANVTTALGNYPKALGLRLRAEEIHKRQGDDASLPYDLANRADLLIRLGRSRDADVVLSELDAGIAKKIESYVEREKRAVLFRTFSAATRLRCQEVVPLARRLAVDQPARELPDVLAPVLGVFCQSVRGEPATFSTKVVEDLDPTLARERLYWLAAGALHRRAWNDAHRHASEGLLMLGNRSNDELRWRLAAVTAIAARQMGNGSIFAQFSGMARDALAHLRAEWQQDFDPYAQRPDLSDLRKRADLQ